MLASNTLRVFLFFPLTQIQKLGIIEQLFIVDIPHMGRRKRNNIVKAALRKVQLIRISRNRVKRAAKAETAGEKLHAKMHGQKEA